MAPKSSISAFTLIVAFFCVALVGLALVPLLPVKLSPSRTLPKLSVSYQMPGNSSRVIEMEVTSRLEAMFARVKGIKEITSTSGNGWGRITLELDKHTPVDAARFEVSTIIRQTWPELPASLSYPLLQMSRPDDKEERPFMSYTLNAAAAPLLIQRFAEEQIKPRLSRLAGIYRIDVTGATPMEWQLIYDSQQLTELGITLTAIEEAISRHYREEFLGLAHQQDATGEKRWIRLALRNDRQTAGFDAEAILLRGKEGQLIHLSQLVQVKHQEEAPQSYYRINGLNSIYLSLQAEETANQLRLAKQVKEEMAQIRALLPSGYEMHVSYDATEYIEEELHKIYVRTGLTLLILLLFVWLITREKRYLALIVVSLAVNLCVAVIFYYLLGLEMQLYSLAGITISLSLVIDNTIVMTDHIRRHQNKEAFLSILAATLTTMGALVIVFFLDEEIRLNLQDFAAVVIINLAVSLLTALFLVPALIEKMGLACSSATPSLRGKHGQAWQLCGALAFQRYYQGQIRFLGRWKKTACLLLLLVFGLPVFLLPEKIELAPKDPKQTLTARDSLWINTYNQWVATDTWKETVKPILDRSLGGTLRLFVEKVYAGSYFTRNEETVLQIAASMPNGTTLEQMNHLVSRMEAFLSEFKEIRQFQTHIYNARQAGIQVYFTRESERSGFPYTLKSRVITKALELGGGSWNVTGLADQGFSNDVRESAGSYRIDMYGYNYDELYGWAERLRERLLTYRRIKEVTISSQYSWWKEDYQEFYFQLHKARLAQEGLSADQLFDALRPVFGKDLPAGELLAENGTEPVRLTARQSREYDRWSLSHIPLAIGEAHYKLSELAQVEKGQTPQEIAKVNQQYRLCLQYEYVGATSQGNKIQEREIKVFNRLMPMGYTAQAERSYWSWTESDNSQYLLLGLIIVIIFFTTSILFNSLKQPLAVIFVIPISYIGVFLTFYLFRLNFDQGGFASFVLLCGITVNASIYILNEYNQLRRRFPVLTPLRAYLKAWQAKITPILLTILSTILGFVPFLLGTEKEAFWFPLAAGTIGGLILSLLGIFVYLPLFTLRGSGEMSAIDGFKNLIYLCAHI